MHLQIGDHPLRCKKCVLFLAFSCSQSLIRRFKDVEISLPIAYGTIAYWLGKKADEYVIQFIIEDKFQCLYKMWTKAPNVFQLFLLVRYHSHKWTVYIRSIFNEDLGSVIKRVVFTLHPSFNNPTRVVDSAPFELSETGWGEFEIGITIIFHSDATEKPIDL